MDEISGTVLRAEVEARLRPVCPDWPESLFQAVISQIVEITIKYDSSEKGDLIYDERIARELVADLKALSDRSAEVRAALRTQSPPPQDT